MNNTATERITALREKMKAAGIAATIIPQTDPHQSEYLASHWQARRWFSGFTGSAGTLVVTMSEALLWVDSRYFLQAEVQLRGSGIKMMKIAMPGTPTINEYLGTTLKKGQTVGLDGMLFSIREIDTMQAEMKQHGIKIDTAFDPTEGLWADRPELPATPIIIHDEKYAGESAINKMNSLREFTGSHNCDAILISVLDEIAWILNIRSRDVRSNPVTTAYLYITNNDATLFVNPAKVTTDTARYLAEANVNIKEYASLISFLRQTSQPAIAVDPATTSARVLETLGDRACKITSPAQLDKAVKNPTQIQGVRQAMMRDGIALVKGFIEIEQRMLTGEKTTELTVAEILTRHRSQQTLYFDDSFETIAGYGPHGAIVHYSATPETDATVGTDNLLLVDSGAQYLDGTTDITRTVIFGLPSEQQRHDFTLVLKGNINLAMAKFPAGTRGTQLDALAHQPLWNEGLNYMHGTGHGVGHFLNVHEGPHSIRTNEVPTPLQAGMLVTDEPGLYLEGKYGIRCENTLLVVNAMHTVMGQFLGFEPVTLFPFDLKLVDKAILGEKATQWLNSYHERVYQTLSPYLNPDEQAWLRQATRAI